MKWTVLVDNRTNDPVLETEHRLSIFLETGVLEREEWQGMNFIR